MKFLLFDDDKLIYTFEVDTIDENEKIHNILKNLFYSEYLKPEFREKVDGDIGLSQYVFDEHMTFNLMINQVPLLFDINDEDTLYYKFYPHTAYSFWTISSLKRMNTYGLIKWDEKSVAFSVAKGGLGFAHGGLDFQSIISLLSGSYVTAILNSIQLGGIIVKVVKGSKNKKQWQELFDEFLTRGIYPDRLLKFVMIHRIWKITNLQTLLKVQSIEKISVLMAACGYVKTSRTEWTRDDSEKGIAQRKKWDTIKFLD
ncbi:hypothetical protein ACUIJP_04520 [Leuconostoc pseudomesenteroides]|uniref:hypothetical protein n=1 Tax=Leuconostoc pseudomesenteroides TaxID=33968 RepID=UPI00403DB286